MRRVAVATDDGRDAAYGPLRQAAVDLASQLDAELVLVDHAAGSAFSEPYGSGTWASDNHGEYQHGERPVGTVELHKLGRSYLLDQIDAARTAGVDAGAWLATEPGALALVEAARRLHVGAVVVPARTYLDTHRSMLAHVVDLTELEEAAPATAVLLCEPDGQLHLDPQRPGRRPA